MVRYKVAVAGCGSMANQWVKYALGRDDTEIVALVDIDQRHAEDMAARHGLACGIYTELPEAIRSAGANLVFDVTIPPVHKTIVTTALANGCDVLGEKPMATTMQDAREMAAFARECGRMYAVMQNRRYLKQIRAFRGLIASGAIGTMGFVTANFFVGPHFGGFRDAMDSPLILDMAIHTFDQARFIIGADPVSVYCHEFNPPGSWYRGNAAAVCVFEFADGTVFSYNGSWCAEGAPTSWEAEWRVTGAEGTAIWDGSHQPYCEVKGSNAQDGKPSEPKSTIEAPDVWHGRERHEGCLDEMFNALIEGRKAETDCADNIKSVAMMLGAVESAQTGRKAALSFR